MKKALYGHPESGAHWEEHLADAVRSIGGTSVDDHPSCFWFPKERLLLSVYVDDLLLSGPENEHDGLWKRIQDAGVKIDDQEPVERFLGRAHLVR